MTAWFYFVAIELLLSGTLLYCSASRVTFQATPNNIYPVLSKTLKLRCAVVSDGAPRPTDPSIFDRQTSYKTSTPISVTPLLPSTTAAVTTGTWLPIKTSGTQSQQAAILHISAILIHKLDPITWKSQLVASVSPYDQPAIFLDTTKVTVAGDAESSTIDMEQGYLEITWIYPLDEQSGNYTCDVFGMDLTLHPVSVTTSVYVESTQPQVSEIVIYVADNDKFITQLKDSLSELKHQFNIFEQNYHEEIEELQSKYSITKAQNIQTGNITCTNSNYFIVFPQPYNYTPIVYTSPSHIQMSSNSIYGVIISNVNTTGFGVGCTSSYSTTFSWLAIDN